MNKTLERTIVEASDATEYLIKKLDDLSLDEKIDIAARMRAVVKNCDVIDKAIKDEIKKKLRNKNGVILGEVFKACLNYNPVTRFQTTPFKEAHPDMYEKWCKTDPEGRITFEPR